MRRVVACCLLNVGAFAIAAPAPAHPPRSDAPCPPAETINCPAPKVCVHVPPPEVVFRQAPAPAPAADCRCHDRRRKLFHHHAPAPMTYVSAPSYQVPVFQQPVAQAAPVFIQAAPMAMPAMAPAYAPVAAMPVASYPVAAPAAPAYYPAPQAPAAPVCYPAPPQAPAAPQAPCGSAAPDLFRSTLGSLDALRALDAMKAQHEDQLRQAMAALDGLRKHMAAQMPAASPDDRRSCPDGGKQAAPDSSSKQAAPDSSDVRAMVQTLSTRIAKLEQEVRELDQQRVLPLERIVLDLNNRVKRLENR